MSAQVSGGPSIQQGQGSPPPIPGSPPPVPGQPVTTQPTMKGEIIIFNSLLKFISDGFIFLHLPLLFLQQPKFQQLLVSLFPHSRVAVRLSNKACRLRPFQARLRLSQELLRLSQANS